MPDKKLGKEFAIRADAMALEATLLSRTERQELLRRVDYRDQVAEQRMTRLLEDQKARSSSDQIRARTQVKDQAEFEFVPPGMTRD